MANRPLTEFGRRASQKIVRQAERAESRRSSRVFGYPSAVLGRPVRFRSRSPGGQGATSRSVPRTAAAPISAPSGVDGPIGGVRRRHDDTPSRRFTPSAIPQTPCTAADRRRASHVCRTPTPGRHTEEYVQSSRRAAEPAETVRLPTAKRVPSSTRALARLTALTPRGTAFVAALDAQLAARRGRADTRGPRFSGCGKSSPRSKSTSHRRWPQGRTDGMPPAGPRRPTSSRGCRVAG